MPDEDLRLTAPTTPVVSPVAFPTVDKRTDGGIVANPGTYPAEPLADPDPSFRELRSTRLQQLRLPEKNLSRASRRTFISFCLMVLIPFATAVLYFAFIAADQYETEFRFSVEEVNPILPSLGPSNLPPGAGGAAGGLSSALSSLAGGAMGVTGSSRQNYMVVDFLTSRQAVDQVQKVLDLRKLFSSEKAKGDFIAAFDPNLPTENLVAYWNSMVSADYDPISGLASAKVRTFDPESSLKVGQLLVKLAEDQVNSVEKRSQLDAINAAKVEAASAQKNLLAATAALAEFRLKESVVDPVGAVAANADLRKALNSSLTQLQTDLASILSQRVSQNAPAVMSLKARIAATREELKRMQQEVSKSPAERRALADVVGRYEKLDMNRQYAMSMAIATRQAVDQARANANAQHLFLTPYVLPALPTVATYPKKYQWLFGIFVVLCFMWVICTMAMRSADEQFGTQ